jgi:hypothetical protein
LTVEGEEVMKKLLIMLVLMLAIGMPLFSHAEELELKCAAPFYCSFCDKIGVDNYYKITFLHPGVTPHILIVDGEDIKICNERIWYLGDRVFVDVPMLFEHHR